MNYGANRRELLLLGCLEPTPFSGISRKALFNARSLIIGTHEPLQSTARRGRSLRIFWFDRAAGGDGTGKANRRRPHLSLPEKDRVGARKYRLQFDPQGVAELADHDIRGDGGDDLDDLGVVVMGVDPFP